MRAVREGSGRDLPQPPGRRIIMQQEGTTHPTECNKEWVMPEWRVKLLYDGECPFCCREVEWLKRRDRHGKLATEDIAAIGFDPARYGLTRQEVAGVLHGILPDGT